MKRMLHFVSLVLLLLLSLLGWQVSFPACGFATTQSVVEQANDLLRQQIENWKTPLVELRTPSDGPSGVVTATPETTTPAETPVKIARPKLVVRNTRLRAAALLARFYEAREYRLAWSTGQGELPQAVVLLDTIQAQAVREGLRVGVYGLEKTRQLLQELEQQRAQQSPLDPSAFADLDLLLTNTFFLYSAHLSLGAPRFDALDAQWFVDHHKTDLVMALQLALDTHQIPETLNSLSPQHAGYRELRDALLVYRNIALRGGWPSIHPGFDLRPGDQDVRVRDIRARLQVTGEFAPFPAHSSSRAGAGKRAQGQRTIAVAHNGGVTYDSALVQAVKQFQKRNGLVVDGVIGGRTWAALNVSVETRIRQIIANMDRWRALPNDLGSRYIAVNIPNFTLDVVENQKLALHMKVVVGKMVEDRHTPTFAAEMTYLVLSPYWHVPKSIAEKELFPLAKNDPTYFSKNNFIVHRVTVGEKKVAAPNATDGSSISKPVYQYRLKQAPGPKNALGRVKFIFPNPYGVYLHDTPSKSFFQRSVRTYSHGCIRIEKPIELAEYLLQGSEKWTKETILETIARQKEKKVVLPEAIPVYIQYWTAWADEEGVVQFRNDIYGYDDVPGARLPISPPANPRPQLEPKPQPVLQEAQSTRKDASSESHVTQPPPQPQPQQSILLESSTSSQATQHRIVQ